MRLDYFFKKENNHFPSSLLLKISEDKNVFSWGLAQYMFTPSQIDVETVQYNDRPYAGTLLAIHSLNSYDYSKKIKLTSEFYLGAMGPLSLAKETQITVHGLFNYTKPEGWKNQVPNDIIINYNLRLEKEMVYVPQKLFITGIIETYTGTLYDAMGAGFSMRIGKVNSFFEEKTEDHSEKKKSQLYVILKPTVRVIYYNALLQGGIITNIKKSHDGYILNKDQVERINVFTEAGIVYTRPKMNISLIQKMRTAPFKGGNAIEVGSISIAFKL
ncbi:MAG: lipid A deacylase LpxR family protein [Ginsengibacter sp.]